MSLHKKIRYIFSEYSRLIMSVAVYSIVVGLFIANLTPSSNEDLSYSIDLFSGDPRYTLIIKFSSDNSTFIFKYESKNSSLPFSAWMSYEGPFCLNWPGNWNWIFDNYVDCPVLVATKMKNGDIVVYDEFLWHDFWLRLNDQGDN